MLSTQDLPDEKPLFSTQNFPEEKPTLPPYELIYRAAKKRNTGMLIKALSFGGIDIYASEGVNTPVAQLAFERDNESVKFLIKFNASLRWVAFGYARGLHKKEVNALLAKVETEQPHKTASILNYIAYGLAIGGHQEEVNKLLEMEQRNYSAQISSVKRFAALGFARARNSHEEELNDFAQFVERAYGLALSGHEDLIQEMLDMMKLMYLTSDQEDRILGRIAKGLGESGRKREASAFIKQIESDYLGCLTTVLGQTGFGYALGGHMEVVEGLLNVVERDVLGDLVGLTCDVACGFAAGGYEKEVYDKLAIIEEKYSYLVTRSLMDLGVSFSTNEYEAEVLTLLKRIKIEYPNDLIRFLGETAANFVKNKNRKAAYTLLDVARDESSTCIYIVLNSIVMAEFKTYRFINEAVILKTLTLIDNLKLRQEYDKCLRDSLRLERKEVKSFIPQTKKCRELMENQGISVNQSIAWIQPEAPIFLLQCFALKGKLIDSLFFHIATFLLPVNEVEASDLSNKFAMQIYPRRFFDNLKNSKTLLVTNKFMAPVEYTENELKYSTRPRNPNICTDLELMKNENINSSQLRGWRQPYIQLVLLQGIALGHKARLRPHLLLAIASFLSPMTLPEIYDLSNKLSMKIRRRRFFDNLQMSGTLLVAHDFMVPLKQEEAKEEKHSLSLGR